MKRTIRVKADEVSVVATIRIPQNGNRLMRDEVERVRDVLADRLQAACSDLPYGVGCPRNRVKVT